MQLSLEQYRSKLLGCWLGKNIGGTLGAPFECQRATWDITYYTQELGGQPLPNDDLDLQLVWLIAAEKYGRALNARLLGEYWLSHITPHWAEYGAGKNNLRMGLEPPLSGYIHNLNRDSCGAFIRSELWACLAPGHPDLAVRYAYEDAIVDHAHEGVYGAVFCAAVQSAAFVESDMARLLAIGLSYIPGDCGVARGIASVLDSFRSGVDWREARKRLLTLVPDSFGFIGTPFESVNDGIPVGPTGYDAPANVGLMVLGWVYGQGDFGASLCTAVNCGEDTDCTAGTLGAILGIIGGIESIPARWAEPLGRSIQTLCIDLGDYGRTIPRTIDELTERVMRLAPLWLGPQYCDVLAPGGYTIEMLEGEALLAHPQRVGMFVRRGFEDILARQPFTAVHDFHLLSAMVDYQGEPYIQEGVPRALKVTIENHHNRQQWLRLAWHLPAGWEISPAPSLALPLEQRGAVNGRSVAEFSITPHGLDRERYTLVLEIGSQGHVELPLVPVVLLTGMPL